jgi:hypothetical protein
MAYELLRGTHTTHLYRHDIESLFYIMLLTCGRHTFGNAENGKGLWRIIMRKEPLPYATWFNQQNYHTLGGIKCSFLMDEDEEPIELSPAFEDFRPWLEDILSSLSNGFVDRRALKKKLPKWEEEEVTESTSGAQPAPVLFDDETLGGNFGYSAFVKPIPCLKGELKGLVVRYSS